MLYFAYGSNLSVARLQKRVPSCKPVSRGTLKKHCLLFHKIGKDGSAKCDAYFTGAENDYVLGVVYKINPSHKPLLDKAEGLGKGYEIKHINVISDSGKEITAFLYLATETDQTLQPFHWYKEHVLRGMQEHNFPAHYYDKAVAVRSIIDSETARAQQELQIYKHLQPISHKGGL